MPRTTVSRSDAEIFADARHALDRRPAIPQGVHVHVARGVVTLTGSVRLPAERLEAQEAVRAVEGIRSLVNDITVTQSPDAAGLGSPDGSR